MKVTNVELVCYNKPKQLYDIHNVQPHNNFVIGGKTKDFVAHNCGLLDEINFGAGQNISMTQSAMMKVYRSVKMRMQSRFLQDGGKLPTKLFMVSSKKSELDFLEQYIKTIKNDPNAYIVDEPIWKVKPKGTYSGVTFKVAVGNKFLASIVLEDGDDENEFLKQGFTIIDVPIEFKSNFIKDIDGALMDIAGISTSTTMKFISYQRVSKVLTATHKNPFSKGTISLGLDDDLQIKDFFDKTAIPEKMYSRPVFIHIDTSLTGDKTGISAIAIGGASTQQQKYQIEEDENVNSTELYYLHLFTVGIQSPSDSEISLEKTRQFIYFLKGLGWNIKMVSIDGFQSADTRQILTTRGYKSEILSLDRSPDGYIALRAAINEQRIKMLNIKELVDELTELEKDTFTGKVDHPDHGKRGSKDCSDSLAGALWSALRTKDEYLHTYGESLEMMMDVAEGVSDDRVRVMQELQSILVNDAEVAKQQAQDIVREDNERRTKNYTNMTVEEQHEEAKKEMEKQNRILNDDIDDDGVFTPTSLDDGIIFF